MSQPASLPYELPGDLSQFQPPAGVAGKDAAVLIGQLAAMTKELFQCDVAVTDDCDPEYPDDRHVVLIVQPRGNVDDIVENEAEWAKRVRAIAPDWESVRLSIRLAE